MSSAARCSLGIAALGAARTIRPARIGRQVGQRDVLADREVEQEAGALAVLGHQEDAVVDGVARRGDRDRLAVEARSRRPAARSMPKSDARQLGAAGADQAGQAEDLAAPDGEVDRLVGIGGGAHGRRSRAPRRPARARRRHVERSSGRGRSSGGSSRRGRSRLARARRPRAPSRSTTTRSAQRSTSCRRCEMKMTLTPSRLQLGDDLEQPRRSRRAVRLEVGSSMMTSRASSDSALAISTSCRWASDSSATGVSARNRRRAARAAASPARCSAGRSTSRSGPPMHRLAADEDIGGDVEIVEQVEFLVHEGDARRHRAVDGERRDARRRRCVIVPVVGATTPPRIFISVDLPAPFSPTRPITSPRSTARLTPSSAVTPG